MTQLVHNVNELSPRAVPVAVRPDSPAVRTPWTPRIAVVLALIAAAAIAATFVGRSTADDTATMPVPAWQQRAIPNFALTMVGPETTSSADPRVRNGRTLADAATFPLDNDGTNRFGYKMLDAPAVDGRTHEYGMVYRTPEYDVVRAAASGRITERTTVHARQGVRTWRWELISTDGKLPKLADDGSVVFDNRSVIDPPKLFRVDGTQIPTKLKWQLDGSTLSLTFSDASLPLPYVIDPDTTNPIAIFDGFTEALPGVDPTDGTFVSGSTITVSNVQYLAAGVPPPTFDVRFRAYDAVPKGAPPEGGL